MEFRQTLQQLDDTIHELKPMQRGCLPHGPTSLGSVPQTPRLVVRHPLMSRGRLLSSLGHVTSGQLDSPIIGDRVRLNDEKLSAKSVYESLIRKLPSSKSFCSIEYDKALKSESSTTCTKMRSKESRFTGCDSPFLSNQSSTMAARSPVIDTSRGSAILGSLLMKTAFKEYTTPMLNSNIRIPRSCLDMVTHRRISGISRSRFKEYSDLSGKTNNYQVKPQSEVTPYSRVSDQNNMFEELLPAQDSCSKPLLEEVSMLTPQFNSDLPAGAQNFAGWVSHCKVPTSALSKSFHTDLEHSASGAIKVPYESVRKRTDSFRKFSRNCLLTQKHTFEPSGPHRRHIGLSVRTSFGKNNEFEVRAKLY